MKNNKIRQGIVGGLLALLLVMTATPAPQARAATIQELQAQIQALIARIQALGGSVPGVTTPATGCSVTFVSDLTIGRSGVEVTALQNFLISKGYSIPAGATGYFGVQTQAAVASFQAANGIAPAAGYFGPITKARVNAMCTVVTPPPANNGGNNGGNDQPDPGPVLGGEADFYQFDVSGGDDTNLEEGENGASIMEVEFEVRDGDLVVNRIDLAFTPDNNNDEDDPWDTFEEVSLYHGSDRIARVDASRESAWHDDDPRDGDYRLRFSGLSWVVEEDEEVTLEVRVNVENTVRGTADGEVWTAFVPDNGIRALDADRVAIYTGNTADGVTIDIDQAGSDDELIVKRSNDDPNATVLQLETNRRSDWLTVFAFDLDTDDSTNDIEIRELPIQFTVSSSTVGNFMSDVRLVVDGEIYDDVRITNGSTNTMVFEFDRGDFVIDSGDRVTVEVEVEFNALASGFEGTTIYGSVNTSGIEAEGADDLEGNQLSGSATSETHTMRTLGVNLVSGPMTADFRDHSDPTKVQGHYTIEFEVTAFNSDIFIHDSVARGTALGTAGVNYIIENSSMGRAETASGTASAVISSNANTEGSYYVVREGETKTFKLFVTYDPEFASFYNVQMLSLNWSTTPVPPETQQSAMPSKEYETDALSITN